MVVDVKGVERTLIGRNLVLCTGPGGTVPIKPKIPGEESFKGTVLHSNDFSTAKAWAGKRGLVIGTGPSHSTLAVSAKLAQQTARTMLRRTWRSAACTLPWFSAMPPVRLRFAVPD